MLFVITLLESLVCYLLRKVLFVCNSYGLCVILLGLCYTNGWFVI